MLQSMCLIGCGIFIGIGLLFLAMGRLAKNCGDEPGAGLGLLFAVGLFVLASVIGVLGLSIPI